MKRLLNLLCHPRAFNPRACMKPSPCGFGSYGFLSLQVDHKLRVSRGKVFYFLPRAPVHAQVCTTL